MMIKREFFVDKICYVMELTESSEIMFYIKVPKSRHIDYTLTPYEELASWDDYGKEFISYAEDLGDTKIKHFFEIKTIMVKFVEEVAKRGVKKFGFGANEDKKMNIYRRVANKVAEKYGYFLYEMGNHFQFYKSP
ncbi:MAG: hypothetical protein J7M01_02300 [Candidatus Marinimicrobia bacterium]|nr:hypothetical protein [Candidatus Neomarinimicrobiota bacterium]